MKTKIYLLLIIGIIFSSCENDSDDLKTDFQLETPDELTELEYELYSLILNKNFQNTDLVIYQKTSTQTNDDSYDLIESDEYFDIDNSTIESFYNLNSEQYILDNQINFDDGSISMISSSDYDYFFDDQKQNWSNFYEHFPNSSSIIKFSKIGFNDDFTEAIVRFSKDNEVEFLRSTLILYKTQDTWEIYFYNIIISD